MNSHHGRRIPSFNRWLELGNCSISCELATATKGVSISILIHLVCVCVDIFARGNVAWFCINVGCEREAYNAYYVGVLGMFSSEKIMATSLLYKMLRSSEGVGTIQNIFFATNNFCSKPFVRFERLGFYMDLVERCMHTNHLDWKECHGFQKKNFKWPAHVETKLSIEEIVQEYVFLNNSLE